MYWRRLIALTLVCGMVGWAQDAPAIQVTGAVKQPLTLTADGLAKMPRSSAQTKSNGHAVKYEGVLLYAVLQRAGLPELRGKTLASYVIAEAKDGYQALFSLAELDPAFTDSEVLLADTADGKPLTGAQGPFRLIVPKDKHGARSVRMLAKLDVVMLRK